MSRAYFESVHADPWAQDFLDLPTLNERASNAVEDAVEHIRKTARIDATALRSSSIVILGPPGAGKTHLFARLRRKLGPRGVFVLVRPLVHAEMTPRFVLGEIVRQLAFAPPRGLPQTSALVGSLLGRLEGVGPAYPATLLGEYAELSPTERAARLDAAVANMMERCSELDETYLSRLLQVPFVPAATARALLAWLSGLDCDTDQLQRIGATASLGEARSLVALRTLVATCALGAPIVLVFDQLENLMDANGAGPRLRAYANLAAEYVDTLRGSVLVHLALDTEWERGIEPSFNMAQRSRIVMRREVLSLPKSAERQALLKLFYQHVLERKGPFPWPLGQTRLEQLSTEPGYTPRMLLHEFKAALDGSSDVLARAQGVAPETAPPTEPDLPVPTAPAPDSAPRSAPARREIVSEWLGRLRAARENVRDTSADRMPLHPARLADGVLALGRFVPGMSIKPTAKPPAQLSLEVGERTERIAIVQESNQRSLAAAIARLTRVAEQAHVVVLREGSRELPESWAETVRRRGTLLETGRARWVELEAEDCARLLALASFLQAARSGDVSDSRGLPVSEAEVTDWVESTLDVPGWPLSRALAGKATAEPSAPAAAPASGPDVASGPQASPGVERVAPESFIQELGGSGRRTPARRAAPDRLATALPTLQRLRVASFERLVREVLRVDPGASRASVLAELDAAGDTVRWLGRSIVFLREHE